MTIEGTTTDTLDPEYVPPEAAEECGKCSCTTFAPAAEDRCGDLICPCHWAYWDSIPELEKRRLWGDR